MHFCQTVENVDGGESILPFAIAAFRDTQQYDKQPYHTVVVQITHSQHKFATYPKLLIPYALMGFAYLEGDVFVGRTRVEAEDGESGVVCLLQVICGSLGAVDQVRVEDVELVALSHPQTATTTKLQDTVFNPRSNSKTSLQYGLYHWSIILKNGEKPIFTGSPVCFA